MLTTIRQVNLAKFGG